MYKYVYSFKEADYRNKKLFGGKGASLIQMTQLGLRVPPDLLSQQRRVKNSTSREPTKLNN